MSSLVHFRFSTNTKQWDSIEFEGSHIALAELKRQIITLKKLNKSLSGGLDFDLLCTNAQTNEGES